MGDMGIGAGFGAGGAMQGLQDLLAQRRLAAQLAETVRSHQADEALRQRQLDEQTAWRQMQQQATNQDRSVRDASTIGASLAPGTSLLGAPSQTMIPPLAQALAQGGQGPNIGVVPPLNATALPGGAQTPALPSGMGMGAAPDSPPPTGGVLRTGPSVQPTETPVAPGAVGNVTWLGNPAQRDKQEEDARMASVASDPNTPPAMKAFLRVRGALPKGENIPYQLITEPNGPPGPASTDANYMLNGQPIVAVRHQGRLMYRGQDVTDQVRPYTPPQQPLVIQTATGPELLDRGSRTASPITSGGQTVGPKPSAQQEQHATAVKDALSTLDQLDQAIESAKDLIGPGQGRVSSLEQMVGNADPKIQALGTKMLLAKMKVDAGIGGTRAAASPQLLSRWDNLLATKVTPEGLKAAVQAMREILGGTSTTTTTKPSAADLIKKYGG